MRTIRWSLLPFACSVVVARHLHSLPEDTYAFPKFRVSFLNALPVLNETAERWLAEGLQGGEPEFLHSRWKGHDWKSQSNLKEIGGADLAPDASPSQIPHEGASFTLERMKMGPRDSYICLIPKPLDHQPIQAEDSDAEITPARSWSLLQPLSGTCLYGWFTYSYCHNEEIRQFKELIQSRPHTAGGYKPEEDPDWESYTLGKAPTVPEPGVDLTVAEQNAQAANLELARNAGSRYLVQRWGDGTICDKTGKHREVEVQFHCSMAMTDNILFVKEAKTCSYVLVVHTPRLCGEPGFKSPRDAGEEALIRCREVVTTLDSVQPDLPEADHPLKVPRRKTVLPPPQAQPKDKANSGTHSTKSKEKTYGDLFRKALEAIMNNDDINRDGNIILEELSDDGDVIVEFLDDFPEDDDGQRPMSNKFVEALRAAGFDVKAQRLTPREKKAGEKEGKHKPKATSRNNHGDDDHHRDEL